MNSLNHYVIYNLLIKCKYLEHFMVNPRYETINIYFFPDVPHCIKVKRDILTFIICISLILMLAIKLFFKVNYDACLIKDIFL